MVGNKFPSQGPGRVDFLGSKLAHLTQGDGAQIQGQSLPQFAILILTSTFQIHPSPWHILDEWMNVSCINPKSQQH